MYEVDMKKRQDVYDLYWYFACERQNIFWKKLNGEEAPWTEDEILQTYKFCNSYRVNDRVSQYLLKKVIYNEKKYNDEDMIFRILLFKLFNKESTWDLLINEFGDVTLKNFDIQRYSKVLEKAISSDTKIYNDAYISCATKAFGYDRKHDNHLALLNKIFNIEEKFQNIRFNYDYSGFRVRMTNGIPYMDIGLNKLEQTPENIRQMYLAATLLKELNNGMKLPAIPDLTVNNF